MLDQYTDTESVSNHKSMIEESKVYKLNKLESPSALYEADRISPGHPSTRTKTYNKSSLDLIEEEPNRRNRIPSKLLSTMKRLDVSYEMLLEF